VSVSLKHIQKEKNMLIVGLKITLCVSEQYCYHVLTVSATPATRKNSHFASAIHGRRGS